MRYVSIGGRGSRAACIAALLSWTPALPAHAGVIPLPAETVTEAGSFEIGAATAVRVPVGDADAEAAARYLSELLTRTNGFALSVSKAGATPDAAIVFRRRAGFAPEAYELNVRPREITVSATSAAGLFYGAVTLWQLLPPGAGSGRIAAQTIRDAPVYPWRGLMLDSSRHFQSVAFIRSMIDWMAWHKLNVLHWHLTDDQGWRLEIRRYPRLTSVGAWRVEPDGSRYGGFYTQDEVREIVRFAATRHVRIVPEIEMPGHATAAIAAYPALGSAGAAAGAAAPAVSDRWGVHSHLFNLEPQTFEFLDNVLAEVAALFPGTAIHIGGDEAVKDEWNASSSVQARARQLGIENSDALQAYFTQRIGRYVASQGRRIIGWDEILRPGLSKEAIVMSWHGVSGAHTAAAAGNDTVLAPWPTLYFDNRQSTLPTEAPGRLKVVSLEDVYRFDPRDPTLSDAEQHHVLGVQANLWTEHIQTEARVQWMALPRAAAVAEVGWSPAALRRWPDFLERLVPMFARYRAFDLNYADSVFAPAAELSRNGTDFALTLHNQAQSDAAGGVDLRYTLDGRDPGADSARYQSPLRVPLGTQLRAAAFAGPTQASRVWAKTLDVHAVFRRDSHELDLCSDGIGLLLMPAGAGIALAVDIMNPCWIYRDADLSQGPQIAAAVAPLPFNYEIGADVAKIRIGDARTAAGELEIHADSCDTPVLMTLPLAAAANSTRATRLPAQALPRLAGRHDLCLRFARPRLDPLWALDWVEIGG